MLMDTQTLAYETAGKTGILVHNRKPPSASEWDAFMENVKADILGKKVKALLVYSDGGAPQHNQRAKLTGLTAFQEIPTAVMLNGGVHWDQGGNRVSAYNWAYNIQTQAHLPNELESVVGILECDDQEAVKNTLNELQQALGVSVDQSV